MVDERSREAPRGGKAPVTVFGPDFPFPFDEWIAHPAGLGSIPAGRYGEEVAVVGAGISGLIAAYELMKLGLKPVLYEASRMGGRLRSQAFEGAEGVVADLGGMRFPVSSTSFYHYVGMLGLPTRPFPNPLTEAAGSTVIDLEGVTHYARTLSCAGFVMRSPLVKWPGRAAGWFPGGWLLAVPGNVTVWHACGVAE